MKKIISVLITCLLVVSLVGCGNNGANSSDNGGKAADEKTKITIWAWDPNFNIAIMEQAKEMYQKDNPNVEFEIVDIAKAELEQKLYTNLESGVTEGLPDIVLIEDYNAQKYLQTYKGSFADLTDKIDHKNFADYKVELMKVDNKVYGVPFDSGVAGFFYRTDYLEQAGYKAEDLNNITWDEFIEIGKKVKEKTGKAMLGFGLEDGGLMRVMLQSTGQWYFDENGEVNLANNPALKEAVETYKKIVDADIIKPTNGWNEWVSAFNSGDGASVITGVWIIGSIKAAEDQAGKWALAPVPRLNVKSSINASNLGGSSWYVMNSSENKDAAIDFLNAIYGGKDEFYQEILVDRGAVGSYLPAQSGEAYSNPDEFFGGQKVYTDLSNYMKDIPAINYGLYTYEADAAIFGVMQQVYSGDMSVDEALKAAEEQLKNQIER